MLKFVNLFKLKINCLFENDERALITLVKWNLRKKKLYEY